MAGSFRIASGYVEVTTRLDKEKIKTAAREAAAAAEAEFAAGGDRSGKSFSDHLGRTAGAATAAEGGRIAQSLEGKLGASGERAGARLGSDLTKGIRKADTDVSRVGDDIGRHLFSRIGSSAENVFGSVVSKIVGVFSKIGSTVSSTVGPQFSSLGASLSENVAGGMSKAPGLIVAQIGSVFSKIGGLLGTALGFALKWGSIVGGSLQVVPPILAAIAGGLAAIPALAVGAAGAIGMLGLGFHGIGAAIGEVFNPPAGGGGVAASAGQIASAERALTLAQRSAADAQINLNEARHQAVYDLIDMNLQLARAHLDEQGATLAVKQAMIDLANARDTAADPLATTRARLALLEAQQGLKEAKQHTIELADQTAKANAAGVEGSDKVKAALEQQQSAQFALLDAINNVKQAQVSAGAAAVSALSKLSPNARAFVEEIKKLKPQLVDLQQYVQDRLFAGLGAKLDTWAHVWIPQLKKDMGDLAGSTNNFAKRLGDDLSKPEVRQAVDGVFKAMERVLDKFTNGGALDKLVTGFSNLVTQATPFVEKIATGIVDELGRLGDWLNKQAASGGMKKFFSDAAHDAKDLWDIGKDVFAIISDIIAVAFHKEQPGANGNPLDQIKGTLDKVKNWADSEGGKKTISDILQGFHDIAAAIPKVIGFFADMIDAYHRLHKAAQDWWRRTTAFFDSIGDTVFTVFHDIERAVLGAFQRIITGADQAFGWVPGLGGKLDAAKKQMDRFVDNVNADLDRIKDTKQITISFSGVGSVVQDVADWINAHSHRSGAVLDWTGTQSFAAGGVFPGIGKGLYRFAEQETGGELLMPRLSSDWARQQALASIAAKYAGGQFVPAGQPQSFASAGGGAPTLLQPVTIQVGNQPLVDLVLGVVDGHPKVISASAAKGNQKRAFTDVRQKAA